MSYDGEEIDVGNMATARRIREEFAEHLSPDDDGRMKRVRLSSDAPERVKREVSGMGADAKAHKSEQFGQASLSRRERKELDFSQGNVLKARSVKAVALGKGVSNWTDFYDPTLSVDEHREVFGDAEGDKRDIGRGRDDERNVDRRQAEAHRTTRSERGDHARDAAIRRADPEAATFLRSDGPGFDFEFQETDEGVLEARGGDADRARDKHAERSRRARRVDERRRGTITTDPAEWAQAPGRYDLPGVDTPQPEKVHERRSKQARRQDERRIAPIAESPLQYVQNPDQYDWPGVDRPAGYGPTKTAEIPEQDRGLPGSNLSGTGLAPEDFTEFSETERDVEKRVRQANPGRKMGLAPDDDVDLAEIDPRASGSQNSIDGGILEAGASQMGLGGDVEDLQAAFTVDQDARSNDIRLEAEQASEFGIDDRRDASRGAENDDNDGDQVDFRQFGGGVRENRGLNQF